MKIRHSEIEDLDRILDIYQCAREFMKLNGNYNQWKDSNPSYELVIDDILNNNNYVIEENDEIVGVFSFIIGEDDSYQNIYDGEWLNNEEYGTIHRLASDGSVKGIFDFVLNYCENIINNIKVDTHHDNLIMQHLIEKNNFVKCGIIYVYDGSPRIAYQKVIDRNERLYEDK